MKGATMFRRGKQKAMPGKGKPGLPGRPEPGIGESQPPKRRKRRTFSAQQQRDYVRAFKKSGQSATAFCAEHGINISCLLRWRRVLDPTFKACGKKSRPRKKPQKIQRFFTPEQRRQAIEAYKKSGLTKANFGKTWGVSASSLCTWLRRYEKEGPKGLEPRRRKKRAGSDPRSLPLSVKAAILSTKQEHPDFGLRKVRDTLLRFLGIKVSAGSVRKTLTAQGIPPLPSPMKRPRRHPQPPRRFERARPGELWQSDITSFVLARHSQRVYLTVFMDDCSRYIVSFCLQLHQKQDIVIEALLEGIARFGKPKEVLTDQGRQYFAWRGKSQFQKLLSREGIRHVVSRTHHPQTLGKCERFWSTVGHEFWERVEPQDLGSAREHLAHFISHYNHFRPHQGIDGLVPADRFFSAEHALRNTLEQQMSTNELDLALGKAHRKPLFLFGQIGSSQVSLHGERGRLVVQTPEGGRQEMAMDDLGMPDVSEGVSEEQCHANDDECGEGRNGASEEEAPRTQARKVSRTAEDADCGESPLATGDRGGEEDCTQDVRDDSRVLAGSREQVRGDGATESASTTSLAALPAGAVGYAGGALEAATYARDQGHAEGIAGRLEGPEEEEHGTGARAGTLSGPDRAVTGTPGKPSDTGGEEEEETRTNREKKGAAPRRLWNFATGWGRGSRSRDCLGAATRADSPEGSE